MDQLKAQNNNTSNTWNVLFMSLREQPTTIKRKKNLKAKHEIYCVPSENETQLIQKLKKNTLLVVQYEGKKRGGKAGTC